MYTANRTYYFGVRKGALAFGRFLKGLGYKQGMKKDFYVSSVAFVEVNWKAISSADWGNLFDKSVSLGAVKIVESKQGEKGKVVWSKGGATESIVNLRDTLVGGPASAELDGLDERFGSRRGGYGRSGTYSGDPRWMKAKRPGKDSDGNMFKAGDEVLYYPNTKMFMTGKKAEQAWREFRAAVDDETMMSRGYGEDVTDLRGELLDEGRTVYDVKLQFPFHSVQMWLDMNFPGFPPGEPDVPEHLVPKLRKLYAEWSEYMERIETAANGDKKFAKALEAARRADAAFKRLVKGKKGTDWVNLNARMEAAHNALYRIKKIKEDVELEEAAGKAVGKGQTAVLDYLEKHGGWHELTDVWTRGSRLHFKQIMSAVRALEKKGIVVTQGTRVMLKESSELDEGRKAKEFKIGDIVRHTSKFLRNTGQYTGNPESGKVVGFVKLAGKQLPKVKWDDGNESAIQPENIEIHPRYKKQRTESSFLDDTRSLRRSLVGDDEQPEKVEGVVRTFDLDTLEEEKKSVVNGKEGVWRRVANHNVFFPDDGSGPIGIPKVKDKSQKKKEVKKAEKKVAFFNRLNKNLRRKK